MTGHEGGEPNIDFKKVAEFFKQTGSIKLISFLDFEGYTFDELDETLDLSREYVNLRKNRADELGLIEVGIDTSRDSAPRIWKITNKGAYFQKLMRENGLQSSHEQLINARLNFEKKKDEFADVATDPDELEDEISEMYERIPRWVGDMDTETITSEDVPEDFDPDDAVDIDSDVTIDTTVRKDVNQEESGGTGEEDNQTQIKNKSENVAEDELDEELDTDEE